MPGLIVSPEVFDSPEVRKLLAPTVDLASDTDRDVGLQSSLLPQRSQRVYLLLVLAEENYRQSTGFEEVGSLRS